MKIFKFFISKVLLPASFFFTLFNIFAYIIEYADTNDATKLKNFLLVLAYFLIVAFANNIFKTDLSTATKVGIHYAAIIIPLICGVMLLGNDNAVGGIFFIVTGAYAVIATPAIISYMAIKRKNNEEEKYDSMFNKTK